jgi:hypothetical protein
MSKPAHVIRFGVIKARIWRRRTRSGPRFTVSVVRLYKNGEVWKESSRFDPRDIPLVRLALDRTHRWLLQQASREPDVGDPRA